MAVAGRKIGDFLCFLCKDHGKNKQADGFCIQCSDYLCKTCFENHKQWRVSKDHTFGNETEKSLDVEQDYDKCSKHVNESIKFYCKTHDQVGCGDCMIVDHRPCTVEYVCEKADVFMNSQEYSCFVQRISKCQKRANLLKPSIQKSKKEITVENDMFVKDVQKFKDEIIACVKQLADTAIQEANTIKMRDTQNMHDLGIKRINVGTDINAMYNAVEIITDQPNKLFVTAIQQKPILTEIEGRLDGIERMHTIEHYHFDREAQVERVLKTSAVLGSLRTRKEIDRTQGIQQKPILTEIERGFNDTERMSFFKHEQHHFDREAQEERVLKTSAVLGTLRTKIFITDPYALRSSTVFVEQFQNKMKKNGIPIETIDVSKVSSLKQDAILILVCNAYSRIECDLRECLTYIGSGQLKQTIIIVLHCGRNIPYVSTKYTTRLMELNDVLEIVDMTIDWSKGLHSNDVNSNAYKKLTTLLPKKTKMSKVRDNLEKGVIKTCKQQ